MEELCSKISKKLEPKPRKVRFRISSSYSGRVLKQVYEDGSESEEPEDEGPHRSLKTQLSEGFEIGRAKAQERWDPSYSSSTRLLAQRINVFRDGDRFCMTGGQNLFPDLTATRSKPSTILNFGKIIIYTSNLRIIKAPLTQKQLLSKLLQTQLKSENTANLDGKGEADENSEKQLGTAEVGESQPTCLQCDGAGCVPCSLCHGSKLSMFANRFKESFRAIRCPGCNENGVQPCQTCAH
ncbi:glutaredoxin domain-containing cysteine-rich protein 2 [Carcharodon carcharias]|uniref:glutaredoxin domain-containing cysteine-rich protein 2 n=1 Tax=Carcharodon carcharias TaxID=13397 RepID=UPI001B7E294E|nr:glutaredoxin domain-containing cysteine-rich protein 2 [Carcharodon carcharias]